MIKKTILILFSSFMMLGLMAQVNQVRQDYINKYKVIAVKKMLDHGIPASITLSQGILESGAGKSNLAREANNHFGIKCHIGWTGDTYTMDDDKKNECFRKYAKAEDSFEDHSLFLTTRGRYAFLFEIPVTDYKKWAHGLKKAGYATNPKYAHLLIKVIEDNQLYKFDKIKSLSEMGVEDIEKPEGEFIITDHPEDFKPVSVSPTQRLIYENQGVRYVLALRGDTYEEIAAEFEIYGWQLRKYNDANKKTKIKVGEFVYIEKKNKKARIKYHIVQRNETLRKICQKYAVRMKNVKKMNGIKKAAPLREGERLKLR